MSALRIRESIHARSSLTWLRNRFDSLLPVSIEPWGSTIFLLPGRNYAIVTESNTDDPPAGTSIELEKSVTIWPEGRQSNRIYRADGNLVWDDANPSQAAIPDEVISAARVLVATNNSRMHPEMLNDVLRDGFPPNVQQRNDYGFLLIEHGILDLDKQGYVILPDAEPKPDTPPMPELFIPTESTKNHGSSNNPHGMTA
jgi:hypothetical protein